MSLPMNATFHVYSSGGGVDVELFVNGKSAGRKSNEEWMGWTAWNVTWAAGNITAVSTNKAGHVVATHSRVTAGTATAIVM